MVNNLCNKLDNTLAWVHNKKAVLHNDRLRWLEIMEMFHSKFKESVDTVTKQQLKDMIKFCGEQSVEIKNELTKIK